MLDFEENLEHFMEGTEEESNVDSHEEDAFVINPLNINQQLHLIPSKHESSTSVVYVERHGQKYRVTSNRSLFEKSSH